MKIHSPIGSKERFREMFQGVNKLNEVATGVMQSGTQLVAKAFEELKNKQASIKQTNTQTVGDENFVEIVTNDQEGNVITFTFKINSTEGEQDGVFNVDNAVLSKFVIKSPTLNVEMPENMQAVQDFNAAHGSEIMSVVGEYADFETDSVSVDDTELEVIELSGKFRLIYQKNHDHQNIINKIVDLFEASDVSAKTLEVKVYFASNKDTHIEDKETVKEEGSTESTKFVLT